MFLTWSNFPITFPKGFLFPFFLSSYSEQRSFFWDSNQRNIFWQVSDRFFSPLNGFCDSHFASHTLPWLYLKIHFIESLIWYFWHHFMFLKVPPNPDRTKTKTRPKESIQRNFIPWCKLQQDCNWDALDILICLTFSDVRLVSGHHHIKLGLHFNPKVV